MNSTLYKKCDMKTYIETKKYWNDRGERYKTDPRATTNDIYMREIEISKLQSCIEQLQLSPGSLIADIGCGNGFSTLRLAENFKDLNFIGYDYSATMLNSATECMVTSGLRNVCFQSLDLVTDVLSPVHDVIITDRCLINFPDWETQQTGIRKIHAGLKVGGYYFLVENFLNGHNAFNSLRCTFGLEEIPVREHNLFFDNEIFDGFISQLFDVVSRENISSMYYVVSRVIYSAICKETGTTPNYQEAHHRLASKLPVLGDFGPISLYCLRRR